MSNIEEELGFYSVDCNCEYCNGRTADESDKNDKDDEKNSSVLQFCDRMSRVMKHTKDVGILLAKCPEMTTLNVGPEQKSFVCHKALLAFKSEYFDAACFGNFASSVTNEIRLEDEDPAAIAAFVSWLYTGRIQSTCEIQPEVLWVLGDKLRSPEFSNEAMHFVFLRYAEEYLQVETAKYVYTNTSSRSSTLRVFIKDLILTEGPLSDEVCCYGQEADWEDLIRGGGDLVVEVCLEGSFNHATEDNVARPWRTCNRSKYLEPLTTTRPLDHFLDGKARDGTIKSDMET